MARASALHAEGHRFDSDILHHGGRENMSHGKLRWIIIITTDRDDVTGFCFRQKVFSWFAINTSALKFALRVASQVL